jgi:hypothetical protein
MSQAAVLWLVLLLVALVVLFAMVARRMSVLVARTRDLERFQRAVASLDARLAATVDPLVAQLDEIRRRAGDPQALARAFSASQATLRDLVREARELRSPPALADPAALFVGELDRASRATDLVEHGLDALLAHGGRRELEAQTSLKRAALNLRHARSAATHLANQIASVRPADLLAGPAGKDAPVGVRTPTTFGIDGDTDDDGVPYPRM